MFVGAPLPGTLRITEVDVDLCGHGEGLMFSHLETSVPGQRAPQRCGQLSNLPGERGNDGRCIFAWHFDKDGEARVPFD